jgi:hypothetical protein
MRMPSMSPSQICLPSLPLPDRYGRGYIAVAVSWLHSGALSFRSVQRSTSPGVSGTPIRRCTTAHSRVPERTNVHPTDAPIPRFVMMGSGVRIPLAAPNKISKIQQLTKIAHPLSSRYTAICRHLVATEGRVRGSFRTMVWTRRPINWAPEQRASHHLTNCLIVRRGLLPEVRARLRAGARVRMSPSRSFCFPGPHRTLTTQ